MKDYYETLGVANTASESEIKAAFRKKAKDCHPDRHPGDKQAEARFKDINEAYQHIGDTKSKAEYDSMRKFGGRMPKGFTAGGPHNFHFNFNGNDMGNIDDLINAFFDQGGPGFRGGPFTQQQQKRNRDLNITIEIGLEIILNNKDIPISFEHNGRKINLSAKLPIGIEHGTKMRFPGHGDNSIQGVPPGDLYAIINIQKHPIFRRERQNLLAELKIDAFDAILGAKLPFKCLDGNTVNVDIPRGTQHGSIVRVIGKGLPMQTAGVFGDLYLNITIIIPTNLNNEQIGNLHRVVNVGK
jgi:DnaJ-class molecular chaperone